MSADERLDRIEQRLATLESIVRELATRVQLGAAPARGVTDASARQAQPLHAAGAASASASAPAPAPRPRTTRPPWMPARIIDTEVWLGQRGLLAVGVVALILAAGYLLKLSFEREWISPLVRCAGGALAGAVVGAVGWRLHGRYRTYGAALVGCGAAIIYLAVWSASRLYELIPPTPGTAALALVSIALAAIAWSLDEEALGATAALGAFLAPILLGRETAEADLLLLYLACMAAGLGGVAAARSWRLAAFVVAASYFWLGSLAADEAAALGVIAYAGVGGAAGLALGLRAGWWETRFIAFTGAWGMVTVAAGDTSAVAALAAAVLLAAPIWWYAMTRPEPWLHAQPVRLRAYGELFYFVLTPLLVAWAVRLQAPAWFDARPGATALCIAVPYLLAGYSRPRPLFAFVGMAALGLAAVLQWPGVPAAAALLALALVAAILDHRLDRGDGRVYSIGLLTAALLHLLDPATRSAAGQPFVGLWPLTLWAAGAVAALLARGLWRPIMPPENDRLVRGGFWTAAGAIAFFGVTVELRRLFGAGAGGEPRLAAELSVSAWWIAFAALLVVLGFARNLKPVRVAGLAVAGLAVAKVVLADLASLDALYRVASVFILGLVSLGLAYLYHRHGRGDGPTPQGAEA